MVPVTPYVERFMTKMYPGHFRFGSNLVTLAHSVANDSSYTYANLFFTTQSVAFACCIFAAKMFGLPLMFKDSFQEEEEPLFDEDANEEQTKLVRNPQFEYTHLKNVDELFLANKWTHIIDERIDEKEVFESLKMINQFYKFIKQNNS